MSLEIKVLFLHKIAAGTKGGEEVRTAWRNITIWGSGARLRLREYFRDLAGFFDKDDADKTTWQCAGIGTLVE